MPRQRRRDPSRSRGPQDVNLPGNPDRVYRGVYRGAQLPRLRRSDLPRAKAPKGDLYKFVSTGVAIMDRNWSVEEHQLEVVAPDAWMDIIHNWKPRRSSTRSVVSSLYSVMDQQPLPVSDDQSGSCSNSMASQRAPRPRQISMAGGRARESSIANTNQSIYNEEEDGDDDEDDDDEASSSESEEDELVTMVSERAMKDVRKAIKRGGCFIFTDSYLSRHPNSSISRMSERFENFYNHRFGDQDAIMALLANREGTEQRTEQLFREALLLKRPVYRIKGAEKVYGQSMYSPRTITKEDDDKPSPNQQIRKQQLQEQLEQQRKQQEEQKAKQRRLRDSYKDGGEDREDRQRHIKRALFQALEDLENSSSSVNISDVTVGVVSSVSALDVNSPRGLGDSLTALTP